MRQTQLFTRTIKELPKDETSYNAQMLIRAGFVDKLAAGVYSFLPLGWRVINRIREIIREEMFKIEGQEIYLPALAPKENWEATGRYEDLDILFKTVGSDEKEYVLNPTHEEIVTPLVSRFVFSYRELPFAVFQIQTKFRNEKRAKAGLLRGREFLMKDLYSFHADPADLDVYYDRAIQVYKNIFMRLGLADKTYLTYSSGGSFSKYSHEFQTLTEAGEDLIYICPKCKVAVNKEIIAEQNTCPECGENKLIEKKAVEVANIFKLMTKFSEAFNLQYQATDGSKKPVFMGCFGIGLSRVLGTIVETCHDERGIIWPEAVAPFKIHLLSLNETKEADKIYESLQAADISVLYDDRDLAAGEKFADADLIGCPYRLVVSKKTLAQESVEIKNRQTGQEELIKIDDLINKFRAKI